MIVCDTSALLAAIDADQRFHEAARVSVESERGPLVLSPFVLAELDYFTLSRFGVDAEIALLSDVASGAYELVPIDRGDVERAMEVIDQYHDLGIGLTDASIVVLAERLDTRRVFTLDRRHFDALRPLQGGRFEISP